MDYTKEQYALMERLASGVLYDELSESEQAVLRYLDLEKVAEPNAQIRDGWWVLSQYGKQVFAIHLEKLEARKEQAQKEASEKAEHERQQRFDNKISVLNLLVPIITFIFGLIAEHFTGIVEAVSNGIQILVRWIASII